MPDESHLPAETAADLHPNPAEVGPGYEPRDTNVRAVLVFVGALVLCLVAVQIGLRALLGSLRGGAPVSFVRPDVRPVAAVDGPAQTGAFGIDEQMRQLRAYESGVLAGEARAGSTSGAAVMPIEKAMDLLAERGLPPTPGPPRTEAEVNSHHGTAAPRAGGEKDKEKSGGPAREGGGGTDQKGEK